MPTVPTSSAPVATNQTSFSDSSRSTVSVTRRRMRAASFAANSASSIGSSPAQPPFQPKRRRHRRPRRSCPTSRSPGRPCARRSSSSTPSHPATSSSLLRSRLGLRCLAPPSPRPDRERPKRSSRPVRLSTSGDAPSSSGSGPRLGSRRRASSRLLRRNRPRNRDSRRLSLPIVSRRRPLLTWARRTRHAGAKPTRPGSALRRSRWCRTRTRTGDAMYRRAQRSDRPTRSRLAASSLRERRRGCS